jgi:HEAT repeat protein
MEPVRMTSGQPIGQIGQTGRCTARRYAEWPVGTNSGGFDVLARRTSRAAPDPGEVRTREEFARRLSDLMLWAGRSYRGVANKSKATRYRLSPTTAANLTAGTTKPQLRSVVGFLHGCGLPAEGHEPWITKYRELYPRQPATTRRAPSPSAARRYGDLEHDTEAASAASPGGRRLVPADVQGRAGTEAGDEVRSASPDEFRADLLALLGKLDEAASRENLPAYLPPGTDVSQMARTVRLLGTIRQTADSDAGVPERGRLADKGQSSPGNLLYALPAERASRADDPPLPWERVAAAHERLVVVGDPGTGKSWLVRTETHRLAMAAQASLAEATAVADDALIPIPLRADVLAGSPGRALADLVGGYLVDEGLLEPRSRKPLQDRVAAGGVVLLIDAFDEVPREASAPGVQTPGKRLEDLLRDWARQCGGTARCVITSRLGGYSGPPLPGAWEVELLPFTSRDARAAIRAWHLPAAAAERVGGLLDDPAVAGLTRIPLLLALICSLAAGLPRQQPLPASRATLYGAVVWQFLSASHRSADRGALAAATDPRERQRLLEILTHVAITFAVTGRGWVDRMSYSDLIAAISGAGSTVPDHDSPDAVLARLADQAGILVPAGNPAVREHAYTFLHRTVAEYLVARYLSRIPHSDRMRIVRAHQWFDPDWAEVIPMLGGLLAAEHPGDAQDLVMHFLRQRRDPLFRAFRTCLRILGESPDPDALLSPAQARRLRLRTSYLLANDVSRGELLRTLATVPALPSAVTDALLEKLRTRREKDRQVRRAAIRALVGRAEPAVADSLLAMAGDRHWSVRQSAIEALAGRDEPRITTALLAALGNNHERVRRSAAEALAGRDDPAVTGALAARLNDQDQDVQRAAIRALGSRDGPSATAGLITQLTDKAWSVRAAALRALASRAEPEVTDALLAQLTDHTLREFVVAALAYRDTPAVTSALVTVLGDHNTSVRIAAARALAVRFEPGVTEALLARLADEDASVRIAVTAALADRDGQAVTDALRARLNDEAWGVRRAAARALGGWREPGESGALLALLKMAARRKAAMRKEEPTGSSAGAGPEELPETSALLRQLCNEDSAVRTAATEILGGRSGSQVTEGLLARLNDADWSVRRAAAEALAGRDEPAVTEAFRARLRDEHFSMRLIAVEVLASRPGVTRDLLARLADRHPRVRDATIEALAGRDDPVILIWLCRRTCWPQQPSRPRIRFDLASRIADRVYHLLPPGQQARIRRRLWRLTAIATDNGRRK